MGGNQRSWKWLVGTGLGVSVFLAGSALAAGALPERHQAVTVVAGEGNTAVASCPSGSKAVSGGFAAPGFDPQFDGASNLPFSSRRSGGRKWTVDAKNFGATDGQVLSYVYCDRHQPNFVKATKTITVPAGQNGTAAAKCPRGSEAFSGGWRSPKNVTPDEAFFAFTSKRTSARKWKVTAFNDDNDDSHDLKVFAYCDKRKPGLVERSKSTTVALGVKTTLDVKCPKGRQAVSGGFESTPVDEPFDTAFTFTSRRTKASTWRTSGYGNGASQTDRPIKGLAYCKK